MHREFKLKNLALYGLPVVISFIMIGLIDVILFSRTYFYATLSIFLLTVYSIVIIFREIEDNVVKNMSQFFSLIIIFSLMIMLLFALIYAYLPTGTARLVDDDGNKITDFKDAFYFSGVTFLTIGYGDITPTRGFDFVAILEGLMGNLLVITFIALGASSIYRKERHRHFHIPRPRKTKISASRKFSYDDIEQELLNK